MYSKNPENPKDFYAFDQLSPLIFVKICHEGGTAKVIMRLPQLNCDVFSKIPRNEAAHRQFFSPKTLPPHEGEEQNVGSLLDSLPLIPNSFFRFFEKTFQTLNCATRRQECSILDLWGSLDRKFSVLFESNSNIGRKMICTHMAHKRHIIQNVFLCLLCAHHHVLDVCT